MENIDHLIYYLQNDIKTEQVHQAAIILYLLEHGGRATKTDLTRHLSMFDTNLQALYESVLDRATQLDLKAHDVFTYDPKTENYFLNVSLLDTYRKETATRLCREAIDQWRDQQAQGHHNKLVRDRIPEIIRAEGRTPVTEILDGQELDDKLLDKLTEEHAELLAEQNLDEISDMIEVLLSLAKRMGHNEADVLAYVHQKREARGGFEQGVYLKQVSTPETP